MWEPGGKNNIISLSENCIYHFDCNTSTPTVSPQKLYLFKKNKTSKNDKIKSL